MSGTEKRLPKAVLVELVCTAEDEVAAVIETTGPLDAETIKAGLDVRSRAHCPPATLIMDGVQLTCARCHSSLSFRTAGGETFAANPGTVRVEE